jgi:putative sterol carrier protein
MFNEDLPAVVVSRAEDAKLVNAKYQMNITGAGCWHLDFTSTGPSVTAGEREADCKITLAVEDFLKIHENPAVGQQLFLTGKLRVTGNMMLGMRLQKIFDLLK